MARIIVQAKDADSNNVDLDSTIVLKYEVTTNTDYGTFINSNGDTLKTSPVVLENITYADAKAGRIKFAAVKENPDSVVICNIKVVLQEDTTKSGEREAVVLEQTLRIEMEEPHAVWPTYARITHDSLSRKIFNIRMSRGNRPVKNHKFRITTNFIEGSGGHDHINTRPDNDNNFGYFLKTNDNKHYRPLEDSTSITGRYDSVTYVASMFGDTMRIHLDSPLNNLFRDSIDIVERVGNLELLGASNNYVLSGGTCNHYGPRTDNSYIKCRTPDNNHWIQTSAKIDLDSACATFRADPNNISGLMRLNDISLPYGGLFDINGGWSNPHVSHRIGNDIDIENRNINVLRRHMSRFRWRYIPEGPNFYPHFRYFPQTN